MTTSLAEQWPLVGRMPLLELGLAALDAPDVVGVMLHGEAGVGKTRLAGEVAAAAAARGRTVARAVASRSAAEIPLGALAHLLPPDLVRGPRDGGDPLDAVRVYEAARGALRPAAGDDRPIVLFVDDLHLLDTSSATLVAQLVGERQVFLIATVRTGDAVADVVSSLWRNHDVTRVDLENLPRPEVETLLHLALGGPVEGAALRALWDTSQGNLLYLHELVVAAIDRGDLVEADGVWQLVAPLGSSPRLAELIGARLEALDGDRRRATELLALCEPVGLADLEEVASIDDLEELERRGLIVVTTDRQRTEVRLAHPLQGEVLRASLPRTRRRTLLRDQIQRVERRGSPRRTDPLRVAAWRLDAYGTADPALLEQAAAIARQAHDHREVARLARAAFDGRGSPRAGLLLGEALYEIGSFAEAEQVLTKAADAARPLHDDELTVQLTVIRTKNLFWGLLDPQAALAVTAASRRLVTTPAELDALAADEAATRMFSGHPADALAVLGDEPSAGDAYMRVIHAIPLAPALAAAGHTARAVAVAQGAFEEHATLGDQAALAHPGTHIVNQVFALTDAGRLDEAEQLGAAGYDITVADGSLIAQIWFALNLGRIALLAGRMATARRWDREGVAVARSTGFVGPLHLALAGLAASAAGLGHVDEARAAIDELDALPGFGFLQPEQAIGRAWTAVAEGDVVRARVLLADAADRAAATGHVISESWLCHDIARLGDPGAVVDRLTRLADRSDSVLVGVRARHAAALADGDPTALTGVVDELESIGLLLPAAEAAHQAADAWRQRGEDRRGASLTERATVLAARCEGATTPGIRASESIAPLSKREREVAALAAQNVPSKQIADRLFLSVRTVNNHLQRIYAKLGVTSRAELADALARRGDAGPVPGDD